MLAPVHTGAAVAAPMIIAEDPLGSAKEVDHTQLGIIAYVAAFRFATALIGHQLENPKVPAFSFPWSKLDSVMLSYPYTTSLEKLNYLLMVLQGLKIAGLPVEKLEHPKELWLAGKFAVPIGLPVEKLAFYLTLVVH